MSRKVYAYVKSETCTSRDAVRLGSFVGRNEEPVSRHGDYNPWLDGKRETLAIISTVIHSLNYSLEYANGKGGYSPAAARNIRHMLESVKTGEWAQVLPQLEIWIEQMELGAVGCGGDALSRYAQYRTALGILAR